MERSAPRIYCIPASEAPVVAVFRRGPTQWSHVGRWNLADGTYEAGAWLGGRLFPRRSDLSPDGRYLCDVAHKPSATWELGEAYVAVSRLPWLTALQAFATCGTWTRGYYFTTDVGPPGSAEVALPIPYQLAATRPEQFATERRRGWVEADDCPPRDSGDVWDERRNARLRKRQPSGSRWLCLESRGVAYGALASEQAVDGLAVQYALESDGELILLDHVQWADWDRDGRLLAATRAGQLHICRLAPGGLVPESVIDLASLQPTPTPAPEWARQW